jgi:hypothetical protein
MRPPPGYVAFGGPKVFGGRIQNISRIARAIFVLQLVSIGAGLVMLALQVSLQAKADDFIANTITAKSFEDALAPFVAMSLLVGLVSIALLVLQILWSYRIASNLLAMGRTLVWKPGLTIVVWLLGGCTLSIIDLLMLQEHWKASDPEMSPGDPGWKSRPGAAVVTGWFVVSLGQIALGVISGIRTFSGVSVGSSTEDVAKSLSDRLGFVVGASLLGLLATGMMILVVRQLTARHIRATNES